MIARLYPNYTYNKEQMILEQVEEKSIEYKDFRDMMISKDADESYREKIQKFEEILAVEQCIFLPSKEPKRGRFGRCIVVAIGRCGTNAFRRSMEQISGLVAGGYLPQFLPNNFSMVVNGLRGEGISDHRIFLLKYPFPVFPLEKPVKTNRVIVEVRDPIDAFKSQCQFATTMC